MAHAKSRRDSRSQRQAAQWAKWRKDGSSTYVSGHEVWVLTNGAMGAKDDWYPENIVRLVDVARAHVK
jgi:hypothetical protein